MEYKECFECNNCGYCCTDPSTQINMSLLDIKWLSDYMNMSVSELFRKEIVTFIPFISTDDFSQFDVEFGMKRPCPLFKDSKCTVYNARPMNCRVFPYWFITNQIEDEVECTKGVKPDPMTFFKYRMYERMIGEKLLDQGQTTEEFIKKIGADQHIDLSENDEAKKLVKLMKRRSKANDEQAQKFARKLMNLADEKVDRERLSKLVPLIDESISKMNFDKEIDMLINAEALLDSEITNVEIKEDNS